MGSRRYIIVDLEGASRLSFWSIGALRDWLYAIHQERSGELGELLVETFSGDGHKIGESEWADDLLNRLSEAVTGPTVKTDLPEAALILGFGSFQRGSWSGTGASNPDVSFHLHEGAIDTHAQLQAEKAARSRRMLQLVAS